MGGGMTSKELGAYWTTMFQGGNGYPKVLVDSTGKEIILNYNDQSGCLRQERMQNGYNEYTFNIIIDADFSD